ncbi:thiolase domain-containing protein [Sphingomonas bacterium]|uniref:thiolase domain-containing protein n=1 Tax=Sphingomonas bacterium TaxID=1895847 RepID=UPI0015752D10|nr:thiolase domain-containing protein [Sphingomonas bacterium]
MEPVIVGWGHTKFGKLDALGLEDLIQQAGREAIADAGIEAAQIDAVWLGHFNSGLVEDAFASSMILGIDPALRFKPATRLENACASGAAALFGAIDAIRSGRIKVALVVGAEKMSGLDSAGVTKALGGASYQKEERGMSFPAIFARFAQSYDADYGDPTEAMAHIAVKNHENALRNPLAQMHRPITLDYARAVSDKNPMIADPIKLSDCSLVSDGAAAVVLVADDMLGDFRRGVGFRAAQQVSDVLPLSGKDLAKFEGPTRAIAQAYKQAGVGVGDLSLAEVHDCFTIAELLSVEALQLAPPGGGRDVVIAGETRRDGRLPINLSGGLKAKGHPVGATGVSMHVLNARQLVGEAGEMQLPSAELAAAVNMGGGAVATYATIMERVK